MMKVSARLKRLNLKEERPLFSCSCCGAPILKRLDMKEVCHKQDTKIMISFCLPGVIQVGLGETETIFSLPKICSLIMPLSYPVSLKTTSAV